MGEHGAIANQIVSVIRVIIHRIQRQLPLAAPFNAAHLISSRHRRPDAPTAILIAIRNREGVDHFCPSTSLFTLHHPELPLASPMLAAVAPVLLHSQ
jgi:hypothetical protein